MSYDKWPNLKNACMLCGAPECAIYRGYYSRFMFCAELEFVGKVVIRIAFCKTLQKKYVLFPDFLIPKRRISRLSLEALQALRLTHPYRLRDAIDELLHGLDDEFYLPLSTSYVYIKLSIAAPP